MLGNERGHPRRRPSLLRACRTAFGREFLSLGWFKAANTGLGFSGPLLLKVVVDAVQEISQSEGAINSTSTLCSIVPRKQIHPKFRDKVLTTCKDSKRYVVEQNETKTERDARSFVFALSTAVVSENAASSRRARCLQRAKAAKGCYYRHGAIALLAAMCGVHDIRLTGTLTFVRMPTCKVGSGFYSCYA